VFIELNAVHKHVVCEGSFYQEYEMRKRRAIVIDDEQMIVTLFRHFFSTRDYEVFSYTRPVECPIRDVKGSLQSTDCPCADVIITDYRMFPMNGLTLLQRQAAFGCPIPKENKAVMSGYINQETLNHINKSGYHFFSKPIDFSAFSGWLEQCDKRVDLSQPLGSRRKEVRHDASYEIGCFLNRSTDMVTATAVNISNNGLCLKLASPLRSKQIVHFKTVAPLFVPCNTASVLWINRTLDGSFRVGVVCIPEPQQDSSSHVR
jgi:CheY-like chemotaxis protein